MAIEEALLAENGVLDTSFGTSQTSNSEAYAREIQEVTVLDRDLEYYSQNQVNLFESIFFCLPLSCICLRGGCTGPIVTYSSLCSFCKVNCLGMSYTSI